MLWSAGGLEDDLVGFCPPGWNGCAKNWQRMKRQRSVDGCESAITRQSFKHYMQSSDDFRTRIFFFCWVIVGDCFYFISVPRTDILLVSIWVSVERSTCFPSYGSFWVDGKRSKWRSFFARTFDSHAIHPRIILVHEFCLEYKNLFSLT